MPAACGDVVGESAEGALAAIAVLVEHVEVRNLSCQFQVRIGNFSMRVGCGDQVVLDCEWKRGAPD